MYVDCLTIKHICCEKSIMCYEDPVEERMYDSGP